MGNLDNNLGKIGNELGAVGRLKTMIITEQDKLSSGAFVEEWDMLDDIGKVVVATLHWDKLSDIQKTEFSDPMLLELSQIRKDRIAQTYTDPTKLKAYFLEKAGPVVDIMIKGALSEKKTVHYNPEMLDEVWSVFKGVITQANSPAPLMDIKGKSISEQIDEILTQVTKGCITFDQAKEYMSLVSSGFNLQELPKLMAQLESLENS